MASNLVKEKEIDISQRLNIARNESRPKGLDIVKQITSSYEELHGDRLYGDDPSVSCGIGIIENRRCIFIIQNKGSNTSERVKYNFGMMNPEGYRKALRVAKLAERFGFPVVTFVDTPGAFPGLEAEKRGQSRAIADNLFEMSELSVPIISVILGEGCSGGALGIGVCDKMVMLEHAYFSVISPEGCASILWKNAEKKHLAAKQLKMQSEDLLNFNMIDKIIKEGDGGFHINKEKVIEEIKQLLTEYIDELVVIPSSELVNNRYRKYRSF